MDGACSMNRGEEEVEEKEGRKKKKKKNAYRLLEKKSKGKGLPGRQGHRWVDYTSNKMDLEEIELGCIDWIGMTDRDK
jgi:hypothetical protein